MRKMEAKRQSLNPARLILASSTSAIPGSASLRTYSGKKSYLLMEISTFT
jgi:hypothetical protein